MCLNTRCLREMFDLVSSILLSLQQYSADFETSVEPHCVQRRKVSDVALCPTICKVFISHKTAGIDKAC